MKVVNMFIRNIRSVFVLSLYFMLVGCESIPMSAGRDVTKDIQRVGVISLTAYTFFQKGTGRTIFGDYSRKQIIPYWNIDGIYEQQINGSLKELKLFDVVDISVNKKELNAVHDLNGPWEAPAFTGPKWSAVEGILKRISHENDLDALIFVIERETRDYIGRTERPLRGVGFYTIRGITAYDSVSAAHVLSWVVLIDGKSGKPIAMQPLEADTRIELELSRGSIHNPEMAIETKSIISKLPKKHWGWAFRDLFEIN